MIPVMRISIILLVLLSCGAWGCRSEPRCVSITEGVYGWTGDFVLETGAGFERRRMNIAWLDAALDGDHVPNAVFHSDNDGFFEITLPAGPRVLCIGTGDETSFHVSWAVEDCVTVTVGGIAHWSYVTDIGGAVWRQGYGPEIKQCL